MNHTCTKVTVRQRAIRNDRISLYLDYYPAVRNPETMQMSRREYLGIYLYAHPKNEMERAFNNEMLNKAEAIRCIRVQSLINEEFGFLDKTKQKADFLAYFKKMCRTKDEKWTFVYQHFYNFVKGKCTFGEVNVDLCKRFREFVQAFPRIPIERQATQTFRPSHFSQFCFRLLLDFPWIVENCLP